MRIKGVAVFVIVSMLLAPYALSREQEQGGSGSNQLCDRASKKLTLLLNEEKETDLDEAAGFFRKAIETKSDCVPALIGYGWAVNKSESFSISRKDYYASFEYLARVFVLEPENATALWVMADLQRHFNRYDRALPLAQKAVELAPDDPWAHYVLGSALMSQDMEKAVEEFDKALELKPRWNMVRLNLAAACIGAGKNKRALKLLNAYLDNNPDDLKALTNRALVYRNLGDTDKAMADYKAVLKNDPRYGSALVGKANVHMTKKEYSEAIKLYKLALVNMPKDPGVWIALGEAQAMAGDTEDAISSFKKADKILGGDEGIKKLIESLEEKRSK